MKRIGNMTLNCPGRKGFLQRQRLTIKNVNLGKKVKEGTLITSVKVRIRSVRGVLRERGGKKKEGNRLGCK